MPTMQQALADAGLIQEPTPQPQPRQPRAPREPDLYLSRTDSPDHWCHQCAARATRLITSRGQRPYHACHEHAIDVLRLARAVGRTTHWESAPSAAGTYDPYGSNPLPSVRHVRASNRR